jgi:hypothetical protein
MRFLAMKAAKHAVFAGSCSETEVSEQLYCFHRGESHGFSLPHGQHIGFYPSLGWRWAGSLWYGVSFCQNTEPVAKLGYCEPSVRCTALAVFRPMAYKTAFLSGCCCKTEVLQQPHTAANIYRASLKTDTDNAYSYGWQAFCDPVYFLVPLGMSALVKLSGFAVAGRFQDTTQINGKPLHQSGKTL